MPNSLDTRIENVEKLLEDIILHRSADAAGHPWAYTYWLSVYRKLTKKRLDQK
jgi:hypothetical protein|tara:strand:- start:334 stop:492 length:159 start_codon:yes stop_codon:yes gene_type:complete